MRKKEVNSNILSKLEKKFKVRNNKKFKIKIINNNKVFSKKIRS